MEGLLRPGQVFSCGKFRDLVYELVTDPPPPRPDKTRLHFDHTSRSTVHWTERREDGWERSRTDVLDLSVEDPDAVAQEPFTVLHAGLYGGGTGHGPHDVYPDGWQVVARGESGRIVRFSQSGCFVGLVLPGDVNLVSDADAEEWPYEFFVRDRHLSALNSALLSRWPHSSPLESAESVLSWLLRVDLSGCDPDFRAFVAGFLDGLSHGARPRA